MILRFGLRQKISAGMGRLALVAMVVMAAAAAPAFAQTKDLQALFDRMERLERDIKTINVHLAKGGPLPTASAAAPSSDPDPAIARLGLRLTELEDELRSTTGRIEELSHLVGQISRRMDKLVGDVDYRLNALEQRSAAAGGGATRMAAPPLPPAASAFGPAPTPTPPSVAASPSPPPVQTVAPTAGGSGGFATQPQTLGVVSQQALE